jgi:hypothetical protein
MGFLAFSIREFAIAAPACVVAGALVAEPRRLRSWALAIAVAFSFGLLYLLKSTLPGQDLGSRIGYGAFSQSTYALSTLSLVLSPAALIGARWWRYRWQPRDLAIGAELGLLVVGIRVLQWLYNGAMPPVLLGNLASQWGVPAASYLIGGRPVLFSDATWAIVGVLALVATVLVPAAGTAIVGAYLRRSAASWSARITALGSPVGLIVSYSIAVVVGLAIYGLKFPLFDRYYWPLIPLSATLFMYRPQRYAPEIRVRGTNRNVVLATTVTAISLLVFLSLIFMLNSFAFDSARWRAGERLVQLGVRPEAIDAGYEWVGYYQPSLPRSNDVLPAQTFYEALWPGRRECGIVTSRNDGPPGAVLVGTLGYSLFLVSGPEEILYLYRASGPVCPPA